MKLKPNSPSVEGAIRLGVSACLLGKEVRYDGGHKLNRYLRDTLGRYVEYVPVCPEVECGLPVPREAMHLIGNPEAPRLVTRTTRIDHTARMLNWAKKRLDELEAQDLCGFVFKSGSPSSGMERVRVYSEKGMPSKVGVGVFARAFMERFSLLPVEEEGRLNDPVLRENFIERIFTLKRWREMLKSQNNLGGLVEFHSCNKLLLLSHSTEHYRSMGRLVAESKKHPLTSVLEQYQTQLMEALKRKATARKNTNVLQHILGYFKNELDSSEKAEVLELIELYRKELLPLVVPLTLLRHYVSKYNEPYLSAQTYLQPHPVELQLRNHA